VTDTFTIIVPVHNGARSLPATVAALDDRILGSGLILFVLNGCTDASQQVAEDGVRFLRSKGADARILRSERPSRVDALNNAEALARGHRIYLDQDAVVSPGGIAQVVEAMNAGADFVGPSAAWRSGSIFVRAAMAAWTALPYVRRSPATAGMYAVSKSGRLRWGSWLEGLPDDKFARLQFEPAERLALRSVTYTADAPNSFRELVRARRRYANFNRRLVQHDPCALRRDVARYSGLGWLVAQPGLWPGLSVLLFAEILARMTRGARR
jgi:glycosyltransferase involved in cell wall biosynthesis